jgi:hypothetical protein
MLHCRGVTILLEEGTAGTVECQFQVYEAATTIDYQRLSEPERKGLLAALLRSAAGSSALVVVVYIVPTCVAQQAAPQSKFTSLNVSTEALHQLKGRRCTCACVSSLQEHLPTSHDAAAWLRV